MFIVLALNTCIPIDNNKNVFVLNLSFISAGYPSLVSDLHSKSDQSQSDSFDTEIYGYFSAQDNVHRRHVQDLKRLMSENLLIANSKYRLLNWPYS